MALRHVMPSDFAREEPGPKLAELNRTLYREVKDRISNARSRQRAAKHILLDEVHSKVKAHHGWSFFRKSPNKIELSYKNKLHDVELATIPDPHVVGRTVVRYLHRIRSLLDTVIADNKRIRQMEEEAWKKAKENGRADQVLKHDLSVIKGLVQRGDSIREELDAYMDLWETLRKKGKFPKVINPISRTANFRRRSVIRMLNKILRQDDRYSLDVLDALERFEKHFKAVLN